MGGKPSKVPGGAILSIREMNPDGLCFDVNGTMRFKDIFYKESDVMPSSLPCCLTHRLNPEMLSKPSIGVGKRHCENIHVARVRTLTHGICSPGEREFLVDDAQIDRKKAGEQLPFLGQKMEWDEEKKEYKPLEGKKWGTTVKGYDMGKYLWVKREKKWLPKFSGGKRVLVEEIAEVPKEPFIIKFPQWWFPLKRYKSLMVWEDEAAAQLLQRCGWEATKVRSRCLQGLWSGLGNVYEIECELNGHPAGVIVKVIDWRDASGPWLRRELKTYEAQASPGPWQRKLRPAATNQAFQWLARLHAEFWGVRAEDAVAAGLHDVGCFWSLDNCRDQLSNLPQDGFGQRLLLAADAVDERLKLELQSICHGDCKGGISPMSLSRILAFSQLKTAVLGRPMPTLSTDHNMCLHDGIIGMFDFQWTGKACIGKDIAYCLVCASGQLSSADEASYLATYHRALSEQLSARQEPSSAPTLEQVAGCYRLALLDLARWMAGCPYGWWGHGRVLKHAAEEVPRSLDGGEETDACPKGKVRIIYSGGKSNQNGMSNGPEDESGGKWSKDVIRKHVPAGPIGIASERLQQLTVALIQGTAMGAGIGLVCACDYVISVKSAFFTMSETKLGAVPATALPYITRRCTFIKNVYQLVLAGANLSSEIAEDYGFVDKVVDEIKDLETECQAVCDRMTLCAPGAVAATKDVVMNTVGVPPSSFMMNYVAGIVADIRAGPECKAGMQAVLNKTRPKWADTPIAPLRGVPAEAQQLAWRSAMVSLLPPGNPFVAGRVFDFGQVQATPRATPAGQVGHVSLPYAPLDAPTYPHFAQPVHVVAPHTIPPGTVYSPVMTHRTVYAAATPSLHSHVVSPMSSPMLGYRPVAQSGMPRVLEGIGTPTGFTRMRSLSQDRVRVDVLERTSSKAMKTEERSVPTAISPTITRSLKDAQSSGARSGTPTRLARSASKELRIVEDDRKIADSPKLERRERAVPQPISPQSSRASLGMRSASWRASTPESSPKSSMRIPSKGRHDSYQKSLQAHGPWDNRNAPGNDFNSSLRDRVLPLNSGRSRPLSRSLSRSSSRDLGLDEDETHAGHRLSRAHTAEMLGPTGSLGVAQRTPLAVPRCTKQSKQIRFSGSWRSRPQLVPALRSSSARARIRDGSAALIREPTPWVSSSTPDASQGDAQVMD
eukprot:s5015_g3.t4